jgi:hypothetical protein
MTHRAPLIIPVENQVRELDPKLLLACIAARRGFTSIIGSHREIDFQIASFPARAVPEQEHDRAQPQDVPDHAPLRA